MLLVATAIQALRVKKSAAPLINRDPAVAPSYGGARQRHEAGRPCRSLAKAWACPPKLSEGVGLPSDALRSRVFTPM